jgi:hypothetical protein
MKYIPLSSGEQAIIDDEDYIKIVSFGRSWYINSTGYVLARYWVGGKARYVSMHNFVLDVVTPQVSSLGLVIDHINHNKLDNRKSNLRLVNRRLNGINRLAGINSVGKTQKYRGVSYQGSNGRRKKKWKAFFCKKTIGYYETELEATSAVKEQLDKALALR